MVIRMLLFISLLWFIRETKAILFWLYLWQLKEYRFDRFLDHFRTEKGKQLILNRLIFFKFFLLVFFLFSYFTWDTNFYYIWNRYDPLLGPFGWFIFFSLVLFLLYFLESIKTFKHFFQKKLKKPVLTIKTIFLILFALFFEILFILILNYKALDGSLFCSILLVFDILTPLITSVVVFIFQPLTILWRSELIRKAKKKRNEFKDLLVIGITGSYGKTSTKEFLATILSEKFNVLKTKEHQNSEVGISQCILDDLKPEHEIFVVEMGAYNRGGIKLLSDICKPKIGVLTGINEQHMATFGSEENIIKGKYELIESLPDDGLAIFNGNNPYCFQLYQKTIYPKKVYSLKPSIYGFPVDIWTDKIKIEKDFISFRAMMKNDQTDFKINLLGTQNILNILAASLVAKEFGLTLNEISRISQKIKPEQGGILLKKGINNLNIIDATYSANPDGVISHLEYLKIWPGKKVIVMPCLIELGKASKEVHQRIGRKMAEVCDFAIITTKERFKEIKEGAPNTLFIENPKEIFKKIKEFCQPGDVVLLESRVPNQLIKQLGI